MDKEIKKDDHVSKLEEENKILKAELERLRSLVPKPQSPASSSDEHSSSPKTREMSTAFRIRPLFEADKCVEVTAELVKIKKKKRRNIHQLIQIKKKNIIRKRR